MIYYKFLRPSADNFTGDKKRITFDIMFVPKIGSPTEKYCYAKIPDHLFTPFLEDYGNEGGELVQEKEFPDNVFEMIKGRIRNFTIITPRDAPKPNLTGTIYGSNL